MNINYSKAKRVIPKHQSENGDKNYFREFAKGDCIYNAAGTDGDVIKIGDKFYSEAIDAWREHVRNSEDITKCINKYCDSDDSEDLVGAHVTIDKIDRELHHNDKVYIVPLCRSCNSGGAEKKIELCQGVVGLSLIFDKNLFKAKV